MVVEEGEMSMVGKEGVWVEDVKIKAMEAAEWVGEMTMVGKEEAWEDKTTTAPRAALATANAATSNRNLAVEQPEDTAIKDLDAFPAPVVMVKDIRALNPPMAATTANSVARRLMLSCILAALATRVCSKTRWDICRTTISLMGDRALMRVRLSMRIRLCTAANKVRVVKVIVARLLVRAQRCKH